MMECKFYENCSAPLCPLDSGNHVWFPDEGICRNKLDWVKNQKKIAKKAKDREGYYTIDMLKQIQRVTAGIVGADPDRVNDDVWIRGRSALNTH